MNTILIGPTGLTFVEQHTQCIRTIQLQKKISNLELTVRVWNNLHHVRSRSKDWKAK